MVDLSIGFEPRMARRRRQPRANAHPADVQARVRKSGSNLAAIGREIGLSRHSMSWALRKPHPRANAAIATLIGVPMHELWPQWFDASGSKKLLQKSTPKTAPRRAESRVCVPEPRSKSV
jgi:lambda repressor-like predicted transcriptional regulator